MATKQAQLIAAYIVDFTEQDGINRSIKELIESAPSFMDAKSQLAFILDDIMMAQ